MSIVKAQAFYAIRTTGNWCDGYYWEIIRRSTGATVKESGPYHGESGRKHAFDDAVEYAWQNDLVVDSEVNPYRGE